MAGARLPIDIHINDAALRSALRQLRATAGDLQPVFRDLGEALLISTRDRFATFTSPSGAGWAALSPAYQKRKPQNKNKILTLRGYLRGTLDYQVTPQALLVGTPNQTYAATHQFGAPNRNIPARPFLGISAHDRQTIDDTLRDHLRRAGVT
ncbi:MAG: hypothetical protein QG599_3304 [Pseudomonadota bacterium]|nr:hypothetical protein [Pseudomonadota bacterium]